MTVCSWGQLSFNSFSDNYLGFFNGPAWGRLLDLVLLLVEHPSVCMPACMSDTSSDEPRWDYNHASLWQLLGYARKSGRTLLAYTCHPEAQSQIIDTGQKHAQQKRTEMLSYISHWEKQSESNVKLDYLSAKKFISIIFQSTSQQGVGVKTHIHILIHWSAVSHASKFSNTFCCRHHKGEVYIMLQDITSTLILGQYF